MAVWPLILLSVEGLGFLLALVAVFRPYAGIAPGGAVTFCLRSKSHQKRAFNTSGRTRLRSFVTPLGQPPEVSFGRGVFGTLLRSCLGLATSLDVCARSALSCSFSRLSGEGGDEGLWFEPYAAVDANTPSPLPLPQNWWRGSKSIASSTST